MSHGNARLTTYGRLQILRHREDGHTQAGIAAMMGVSRATVGKWLKRYAQEGVAGLADRSSRPHHTPHALTARQTAEICQLRTAKAYGPHRLSYELKLPRSTIYGVLRRTGLQRLASLHRTTREVIRYERAHPGELLHLDVKKLGRIPDGGGKRFDPGFSETGTGRHASRGLGHDYLHVAVDDHSRYAYVEALSDERGDSTAGFLERALEAFAAIGVHVQRILSDNGGNYRSHAFRTVAEQWGVQLKRTRPYRPQTNGKAEAFNKTLQREWAYRRLYRSNAERLALLPDFLTEYNAHRPHTALGGLPPIARICQ